ncbi:hypothetical protein OPKNFCMD_5973 [Methylobacterium crusticola]|uniref:Uncharacterized protein n=1 Tax=Methylobacterium crusticola TaxID=1697972 RepID=A0ABQ4R664_9HYPH|nr:hypothetical protein [Methylobacterium crusticola]GJD53202.1 hypothetical protein OPKNFCMD_5973 [Methylobacterium crusticola]
MSVYARRRGLAFEAAVEVSLDPFAIAWIDDRNDDDEERIGMPVMCDGALLFMTDTGRAAQIPAPT